MSRVLNTCTVDLHFNHLTLGVPSFPTHHFTFFDFLSTVLQACKSMSRSQSSLLEGMGDDDLDPSGGALSHGGSNENLTVRPSVARRRANLQDIENLYFAVSLLFIYFFK